MNLHSFQSALAYAIRSFDGSETKNVDDLARIYDLSCDDKATLEQLITQQRLKAYSEELFSSRWTIIREALMFLQSLVDLRAMSDLWEQDFEKKSTRVIQEELALRFVDYLVNDPKGLDFISNNTPPYFPDLMRYVRAIFTFKHNKLPHHDVKTKSALTDRYFEILQLHYDPREFLAELVELDDSTEITIPPPEKRDVKLLFVESDVVTEFRSFEIDDEVEQFLRNELRGNMEHNPRPSCFEDLVEIGLCKPLDGKPRRACCDKQH